MLFYTLPFALFTLLVTTQAASAASNSSGAIGTATVTMANGANTIPVLLKMRSASKIATGGNDLTRITGRIVAAVINPAVGTYTVVQAI